MLIQWRAQRGAGGATAPPVGKIFGGNQPVGGISPEGCIVGAWWTGILVRHNFLGVPTKCLMYRQNLSKKWPFQHLKTLKISRSLRSLVYRKDKSRGARILRDSTARKLDFRLTPSLCELRKVMNMHILSNTLLWICINIIIRCKISSDTVPLM